MGLASNPEKFGFFLFLLRTGIGTLLPTPVSHSESVGVQENLEDSNNFVNVLNNAHTALASKSNQELLMTLKAVLAM